MEYKLIFDKYLTKLELSKVWKLGQIYKAFAAAEKIVKKLFNNIKTK